MGCLMYLAFLVMKLTIRKERNREGDRIHLVARH